MLTGMSNFGRTDNYEHQGRLMAKALLEFRYLAVWFLFICMLAMFWFDYKSVEKIIISNNNKQKIMVENNIFDSLMHVDRSYRILEYFLNDEMKSISQNLVDKYKNNPDVYDWNLENIKKNYPNYDFYIINENLEVVRTTMSEDLGLNFNQFPNFANLLEKRMSGDRFHADRMDFSTKTHRLKKYSYMPTPDQEYLIELSVDIETVFSAVEEVNIFDHANTLVRKNDIVRDISFYKTNKSGSDVGLVIHEKGPYLKTDLPKNLSQRVQKAVQKNDSVEHKDSEQNITHKYIPYLNYTDEGKLDWWNSYVVSISYNDWILKDKIQDQQQALAIKIVILAIMFAILNLAIAYQLRRTQKLSSLDSVTLLPNRSQFEEHFRKQASQEAYKSGQSKIAILYVDLDKFKHINDHYGHNIGDNVLIEIASILKSNLRKDDLVIRSGGDEFWIMISNVRSENDIMSVLEKIHDRLSQPLHIENYTLNVQASIGVSLYPESGESLHEIIHHADQAMYQAKQEKGGQTRWVLHSG